MISLKTYSALDYVLAFAIFFAPFMFNFGHISESRNFFMIMGAGVAIYSLLTNYSYSFKKFIPVRVHMGLDVAVGLLVLWAPFMLGYGDFLSNQQFMVHVILAVGLILIAALARGSLRQQKVRY